MDEENKETVVLGIITRGASKFGKISQETKIEPKELESILQKLENSGLIKVDEKKGWLGIITIANAKYKSSGLT